MMHAMVLAWKNSIHSFRQTIAILLLSLCAMSLMVIGCFLGNSLQAGLTAAVEPFDMLAGYGGSYQLVLNTVFLQDYPAGNISYRLVKELNNDPRIKTAIPLAFGDNYQGYRIVGTEKTIFSHFARADDRDTWLRFEQGESFTSGNREAVIGCRVAADLGLSIGDSIMSTHGFVRGGLEHAHAPYVVSGILASCRGPYDQAIFVDIQSIWDAHGIHTDPIHAEGEACDHHHDDHDHNYDHDVDDRREVTAIMVKPAGFADTYELYTEFSSRRDMELVFPAQVVIRLLSVLGQADWLFKAIGFAAGSIAAITIGLALYWTTASRENEALILRLMGAEKRDLTALFAWEGILSIVPGLVAGCVLGHAALAVFSYMLEKRASLYTETGMTSMDLLLGLLLLFAGMLGEIAAYWQITRKLYRN